MKLLKYSILSAIKSIWKEKWINFLTVLSISIGLSLLCLFAVLTINLDSLLNSWSKNFGIVAYLNEETNREGEKAIYNTLSQDRDIVNITYISREQAMNEVRETLGDNAIILSALNKNPLPASFELRLNGNMLDPSIVRMKAKKIGQMRGVKEVQYGEKWLSSLYTVSRSMKIGALVLGFIILIAITFITYSTIKIFFYRRHDEVETLKLLGATKGFIRLPFLMEGLIIGALGGAMSSAALFGSYSFTTLKLVEFIPAIKDIITTLPGTVYLLIPAFGAGMSTLGSFFAVGRIRY